MSDSVETGEMIIPATEENAREARKEKEEEGAGTSSKSKYSAINQNEMGLEEEIVKALSTEACELLMECYWLRKECCKTNESIASLEAVVAKHASTGFQGSYAWDAEGQCPKFVLLESPRLKALPTLLEAFKPQGCLDVVRGPSALLKAPELEARYAALYEYSSYSSMKRLVGEGPDDLWPLVLENAVHLSRNCGLLTRHVANFRVILADFQELLAQVEAEGRAQEDNRSSSSDRARWGGTAGDRRATFRAPLEGR